MFVWILKEILYVVDCFFDNFLEDFVIVPENLNVVLKNLFVNIFFLQAVKYYAKSEQVLKDFGDHPSFSGIQSDCQEIVVTLRNRLKEQFNEAEVRRYVKEIIFLCLLTDSCPCLHLHR